MILPVYELNDYWIIDFVWSGDILATLQNFTSHNYWVPWYKYGYMKEKQVLYAYFELWHGKNNEKLYLDISYDFQGSGIILTANKNIIIKFIEQINV